MKYKRFYYENDEGIRLTVDYGMQYHKCAFIKGFVPVYLQQHNEEFNVLELKGDSLLTSSVLMNSKLNWRRFSKYSNAMLALY